MKLLPVIFERNEADFGAIAGQYGEKIQRNCSQKEPKEQDKINFRQALNYSRSKLNIYPGKNQWFFGEIVDHILL